MPRRSQADLSIVSFARPAPTLKPPPEWSESSLEATTFRTICASVPAGHFLPEDRELLIAYCNAACLEQRAAQELAAGAVLAGRVSPWLEVGATAAKTLAAISVRLRIGPRSRRPDDARRGGKKAAPSYYETMRRNSDASD